MKIKESFSIQTVSLDQSDGWSHLLESLKYTLEPKYTRRGILDFFLSYGYERNDFHPRDWTAILF